MENKELQELEVNMYAAEDGCGNIKAHCAHDCIWSYDEWLSPED